MIPMASSEEEECDVLVVGAGPAGSSAARAAAELGASVIMIDRRRQIGVPAQCAGFLPLAAVLGLAGFDLADSFPVKEIKAFFPDGSTHRYASPGFIIQRDLLDQWLARMAGKAGARILPATRALRLAKDGLSTELGAVSSHGLQKIRAKVVIGADGPRSRIAAAIGRPNRDFVVAAQCMAKLTRKVRTTQIYLGREFPGGYGWLFPCGHSTAGGGALPGGYSHSPGFARIGAGVEKGVGAKPHQALKWLLAKLAGDGLIESRTEAASGGLIPVGGPLNTRHENVILAGDAAGLCHPVTGAGIWLALHSGALAGEAAARAARDGDFNELAAYAREIESLFGVALRSAYKRRKRLYEPVPVSDTGLSAKFEHGWFGARPARAGAA